jgi:hypothetical protein
MLSANIDELKQKLAVLSKQAQELKDAASGIPSFERNLVRIQASLNMMNIALGGSVVDES